MFISTHVLNSAVENYRRKKDVKKGEGFTENTFTMGAITAFDISILLFSVIFFIMELVLLFYGIFIAFNCSQAGSERIVHVTLAIFFTLPYVLLMALFNKCAGETLRGRGGWVNTTEE